MNSMLIDSEQSRRRYRANPAHMHPDDLAQLGLEEGAEIRIEGSFGAVEGQVHADPTLKRKVVTMSHCWGLLPGEIGRNAAEGTNTNLLTSAVDFIEPVNAMARMTGIPVNIQAAAKLA